MGQKHGGHLVSQQQLAKLLVSPLQLCQASAKLSMLLSKRGISETYTCINICLYLYIRQIYAYQNININICIQIDPKTTPKTKSIIKQDLLSESNTSWPQNSQFPALLSWLPKAVTCPVISSP